jgi:hypothetical protein
MAAGLALVSARVYTRLSGGSARDFPSFALQLAPSVHAYEEIGRQRPPVSSLPGIDKGLDIGIVSADGGAEQPAISEPAVDIAPAWSRDPETLGTSFCW